MTITRLRRHIIGILSAQKPHAIRPFGKAEVKSGGSAIIPFRNHDKQKPGYQAIRADTSRSFSDRRSYRSKK